MPDQRGGSTTAGQTKTAIWVAEAIAISVPRPGLPRRATTIAPPCSAALPTSATITAATKKLREPEGVAEALQRADEELGDDRRGGGGGASVVTARRRLQAPRTGGVCASGRAAQVPTVTAR